VLRGLVAEYSTPRSSPGAAGMPTTIASIPSRASCSIVSSTRHSTPLCAVASSKRFWPSNM
jgi:hypothetical protein